MADEPVGPDQTARLTAHPTPPIGAEIVSHRPSDAYRAQLDTYLWFKNHPLALRYANLVEEHCTGSGPGSGVGSYYATVLEAFGAGETYWVSPEMVDVLQAAAPKMPDHRLTLDFMPSRRGVAYLARDLEGVDTNGANGGRCLVGAISWSPVTVADRPCLALASFTHLATTRRMEIAEGREGHARATRAIGWPPLDSLGWSDWPVGDAISDTAAWLTNAGRAPTAATVASASEDRRLISALWTLSQQRLTDVRQERIDRPTARTYSRRNVSLVRDHLTVIRLRRPAPEAHEPGGHRDVNWSHRWIVGGHWRDQWYPATKEHHPIWISPYVKGPDDKPFNDGGTVKAWTR